MSKKEATGRSVHGSKLKASKGATERVRAARSLEKNKGLLKTIFDILPIGIQVTDKNGVIIQQNPADKKIYADAGCTEPGAYSECKNRRAANGELIAFEDLALMRAIHRGEKSTDEEIEIKCHDGTSRIILNSTLPVYDARRKITGAIVVNQDVTEQKETELDSTTAVKHTENVRGGKESILVVNDEALLVEMNKQRLERLGYTIVGSTSSVEALETFRNEPHKFDLVVTDYTMPHMTGLELARELLSIRPDLSIIMCSGLNEPVPTEKIREAGIREFFIKPIGKNEFGQIVRRVLDKKGKH